MNKKAFTTHEAAEYCKVTPATIIRWINSGRLKSLKTAGGHRRILTDDLIKFWEKTNPAVNGTMKILVIDDEPFIVDFFKEAIGKIDSTISVDGAYSGFEAGEKIHVFKPNIVFLDIVMKGMDGFQVCRKIKESSETSNINVIAITGFPSQNNMQKIKECGVIEVLEKPIKIADIRRVLLGLLQLPKELS